MAPGSTSRENFLAGAAAFTQPRPSTPPRRWPEVPGAGVQTFPFSLGERLQPRRAVAARAPGRAWGWKCSGNVNACQMAASQLHAVLPRPPAALAGGAGPGNQIHWGRSCLSPGRQWLAHASWKRLTLLGRAGGARCPRSQWHKEENERTSWQFLRQGPRFRSPPRSAPPLPTEGKIKHPGPHAAVALLVQDALALTWFWLLH